MDTPGGFARRAAFIGLRLRLYLDDSPSPGMAHANSSAPRQSSYHGEVWTDARGFATVRLPIEARPPDPPFDYELRDLDPPSSARVTAELEDGHFTMATDEPHVKVAWRVTGHPPHRQQKEE